MFKIYKIIVEMHKGDFEKYGSAYKKHCLKSNQEQELEETFEDEKDALECFNNYYKAICKRDYGYCNRYDLCYVYTLCEDWKDLYYGDEYEDVLAVNDCYSRYDDEDADEDDEEES